jgi:small-conductance mechanosensitive channel
MLSGAVVLGLDILLILSFLGLAILAHRGDPRLPGLRASFARFVLWPISFLILLSKLYDVAIPIRHLDAALAFTPQASLRDSAPTIQALVDAVALRNMWSVVLVVFVALVTARQEPRRRAEHEASGLTSA